MKGNPKDNRKKTIIILTILIIIWAISFYSYITYNKIDVEDTKHEAEKLYPQNTNKMWKT